MAGSQRTKMEPAGGGQVEAAMMAANLQIDCAEEPQRRGLLGDPQRILGLAGLGQQKMLRQEPEACTESGRIGPACLMQDFGCRDPEQWATGSRCPGTSGKGQRQAGRTAGIAHRRRMDFRQAGTRHATSERPVERPDAGGDTGLPGPFPCLSTFGYGLPIARSQSHRQRSLDPRNLAAQSQKSVLRQSWSRHGGRVRPKNVLSLFPIDSRAHPESQASRGEFIPLRRPLSPFPPKPLESPTSKGYMRQKDGKWPACTRHAP